MSADYYDPVEDARPYSPSPLLQAIRPKALPSPSPPPSVTPHARRPSPAPDDDSRSSRRLRKQHRQKSRASQSDFVLIRTMEPNRPDIARLAGQTALLSEGSETDDDDDMEKPASPPIDLRATAQKVLDAREARLIKPPPLFNHRDSVVEEDNPPTAPLDAETTAPPGPSTGTLATDSPIGPNGAGPKHRADNPTQTDATSPKLPEEHHAPLPNGHPHEESLATSPNLRQLAIPRSRGSPSQTLPVLQPPRSPSRDGPVGSPNQERLPSFREISDIAKKTLTEQESKRTTTFAHRQSVSSSTQSPITTATRQLSISSALSPGSAYPPLTVPSPKTETTSKDLFLRSGQSHLTLFSTRRPSQASESSPYSATLHSASTTNDSYQSSDGMSPGAQPTSIESHGQRNNHRTLPPPNVPHIQHIPPHGSGVFKCTHSGCNATPFQTQYLLNSHANVHSQSRPHYCPVSGCSRGEGGKGFKRKNEMIRHGLVHRSPGYVCPFCPDREHKYPRPDNLQRHVRVHHVDKNKDDPELREVLAQRPEGGSRGRRRRVKTADVDSSALMA